MSYRAIMLTLMGVVAALILCQLATDEVLSQQPITHTPLLMSTLRDAHEEVIN